MEYEIKAGTKLFNTIEAIQKLNGATLTEVADSLDTPRSTVHIHLQTLKENGYVVERGDEYHLSLKFLDHGVHAKRKRRIARIVPPVLKQLAEDTNEAAWLMVMERDHVVGIEKELGERGVQTTGRIGRHTRFHYHAPGKAMLAELPEERVDEVLDEQGMTRSTENTITDVDELKAELAEIRDRGVAFDVGEAIEGIRSVASPVVCEGDVEGAIAVVGPKNRLRDERFHEEIPTLVSGAANELELRLRYDSP